MSAVKIQILLSKVPLVLDKPIPYKGTRVTTSKFTKPLALNGVDVIVNRISNLSRWKVNVGELKSFSIDRVSLQTELDYSKQLLTEWGYPEQHQITQLTLEKITLEDTRFNLEQFMDTKSWLISGSAYIRAGVEGFAGEQRRTRQNDIVLPITAIYTPSHFSMRVMLRDAISGHTASKQEVYMSAPSDHRRIVQAALQHYLGTQRQAVLKDLIKIKGLFRQILEEDEMLYNYHSSI